MGDLFISTSRQKQLDARMAELGIMEADLVEKFVLGTGSGGQKVNKTSSCVYLSHAKSGIDVKCQKTRARALNRYYARQELCNKLEEDILGKKSARRQKAEKIRRQKRRRSRRQKEEILEAKHKTSDKKRLRRRVHTGEQ